MSLGMAFGGSAPLIAAEFTLLHFIPNFEELDKRLAQLFPVLPENDALPLYNPEVYSVLHLFLALVSTAIILVLVALTRMSWAREQQPELPEPKFSARNFLETALDLMINLGEQVFASREKALRYLPLIGSLAIFIFVSNALALFPAMAPPTDAFSITVAPALVVFFLTHWHGLRENGMHHITHLFGPALYTGSKTSPVFFALLLPLLIFHVLFFIIEVISHLARPLSLSLRLMGNMTGDHMVLGVFMGLAAWPLLFPVPILFIGTIVVTVQTVVFCVLSMVYIALAIEHSEEAH